MVAWRSPGRAAAWPDFADQRSTGSFAALTSSGRLTTCVCGAARSTSAGSSLIFKSTSAKASSVSLLSVSVGSTISASDTTSGKYTVGAW